MLCTSIDGHHDDPEGHFPAKWPMLSSAGQQGIFFGASFPVRRLTLSFVTLCATLLQGSCHFRSNGGGVALGSAAIWSATIRSWLFQSMGDAPTPALIQSQNIFETFIPTVRISFSKPQLQGGLLSYSNGWLSKSLRVSNSTTTYLFPTCAIAYSYLSSFGCAHFCLRSWQI